MIQALGLDRPVVGGHSMGADTSMHLAAVHPHLTRGIFLEDPPIMLPGEKWELPDENLEGADHNIRRTRFDGYMPALKRFLESIYLL